MSLIKRIYDKVNSGEYISVEERQIHEEAILILKSLVDNSEN